MATATRYIRLTQLGSRPNKPGRWPVCEATIWRWVKAKKIPAPMKIGGNTTVWPLAVIEAYEAEQAAATQQGAQA